MESRAKIFGHPAHPILVAFPVGLFVTAVVFDLLHLVGDSRQMAEVAYWTMAAGILGGLVAAPFGLVDWMAIPEGTRAKAIGRLHGIGNVVVILLFIGSWLLRRNAPEAAGVLAHVLSLAGVALVLVTGWLGGELVDRLGVGVDEGAHLNAPSSLSGRPTQ